MRINQGWRLSLWLALSVGTVVAFATALLLIGRRGSVPSVVTLGMVVCFFYGVIHRAGRKGRPLMTLLPSLAPGEFRKLLLGKVLECAGVLAFSAGMSLAALLSVPGEGLMKQSEARIVLVISLLLSGLLVGIVGEVLLQCEVRRLLNTHGEGTRP